MEALLQLHSDRIHVADMSYQAPEMIDPDLKGWSSVVA